MLLVDPQKANMFMKDVEICGHILRKDGGNHHREINFTYKMIFFKLKMFQQTNYSYINLQNDILDIPN